MDKWNRKYIFEPGKIYQVSDSSNEYYRFDYSELIMESYISYVFSLCTQNVVIGLHEDGSPMLNALQLAPPAVQVLYGQTKERKT